VAEEMSVKYREEAVEDGVIRFYFETDSREQSNKLALAIPREAYLYRGEFVGPNDPRL
jgi:hypothetical protein